MTGALRGKGVLAIWNGIALGHEDEFLRWHANEHIPERLSVPGFLRARRYFAADGTPKYFNFYEVACPDVLTSDAYLERLNDPSDWTQAVVPNFTDTSRTVCRVVESAGHGAAGYVVAIRLSSPAEALSQFTSELAQSLDITAAHLLGEANGPAGSTAESKMRGQPDATFASILLIEGIDQGALTAAAANMVSDAEIRQKTGRTPTHRGLYQLDFIMDRNDAV
jgi:hypothetical protein